MVTVTSPRARKRDPDATRRAILRAAEKLFVDRGFAATSMNDIAGLAGVTKSLIHHHFGSKERLWAELKRKLLAHYAEVQGELNLNPDMSGDVLERSVDTLFDFLRDNPRFVRLSLWIDLEKDKRLADLAYPELVSTGIERIRALQEAGTLRADIEPPQLIAAMVSLCAHWFRARAEFSALSTEGEVESWDESYRNTILKILREGVLVPS